MFYRFVSWDLGCTGGAASGVPCLLFTVYVAATD